MGTFTARILVGESDVDFGGICPSHILSLWENSRPSWRLVRDSVFDEDKKANAITWLPTVEHLLEDALLMIGIYVIKDEQLIRSADRHIKSKDKIILEDIREKEREWMYKRCREIEVPYKIVVTVLEGSTLMYQLKILEQYKMDVEVCVTKYFRVYSEWSKETIIKGEL